MGRIPIRDADSYLEEDFSDANGDEKRSSRKARGSEMAKGKRHSRQGDIPIPHMATVGDRLYGNISSINKYFVGPHTYRPLTICGIYRHNNRIVAVDLLESSINLSSIYPNEFVIRDPQHLLALHSDASVKLKTDTIYTVPNQAAYFGPLSLRRMCGHLPDTLWRDVLVRQAALALFTNRIKHAGPGIDMINDPNLVREGFTLDIPDFAIFSGQWAPYLPGGAFRRVDSELLSRDDIQRIVDYANATCQNYGHIGAGGIVHFAPSSQWQLLPLKSFIDWRAQPPGSVPACD